MKIFNIFYLHKEMKQRKEMKYKACPTFIYFGGCAFAAPFYAGVYKSMEKMWGPYFHENCILFGDSAGAIFAVGIALGKSPEMIDFMYRSFAYKMALCSWASMDIPRFMEESIRQLIGDDDMAYIRIQNRCFIGITHFFCQHSWKTEFRSNDDMINTLLYSCRIPLYCRHSEFYNCRVDGAYSLTGTDLPDRNATLFVRVDDDRADITCFTSFMEAFLPMVGDKYDALFQQGEQKMLSWDGIYSNKRPTPHYGILCFLWVLYGVEAILYRVLDRGSLSQK